MLHTRPALGRVASHSPRDRHARQPSRPVYPSRRTAARLGSPDAPRQRLRGSAARFSGGAARRLVPVRPRGAVVVIETTASARPPRGPPRSHAGPMRRRRAVHHAHARAVTGRPPGRLRRTEACSDSRRLWRFPVGCSFRAAPTVRTATAYRAVCTALPPLYRRPGRPPFGGHLPYLGPTTSSAASAPQSPRSAGRRRRVRRTSAE